MKKNIFYTTFFIAAIFFQSCGVEEKPDNRYLNNLARAEALIKKYDLSDYDKNFRLDRSTLDQDIPDDYWVKIEERLSGMKKRTKTKNNLRPIREKFQNFLFENTSKENRTSSRQLFNELSETTNVLELQKIVSLHEDKFPDELILELKQSVQNSSH